MQDWKQAWAWLWVLKSSQLYVSALQAQSIWGMGVGCAVGVGDAVGDGLGVAVGM